MRRMWSSCGLLRKEVFNSPVCMSGLAISTNGAMGFDALSLSLARDALPSNQDAVRAGDKRSDSFLTTA